MGFFSTLMNSLYENGIKDLYDKFLISDGEYNTDVLACGDSNYSYRVINRLFHQYNIPIEVKDEGFVDFARFEFENCLFESYVFKHYARSFTVSTVVEPIEKDAYRVLLFCNEVNKHDLIHQVGTIEDEDSGELIIRVTRQFLFTPKLGSVEDLVDGLRELKNYANQLSLLRMPDKDAWKKYARIENVDGLLKAEDFWFTNDKRSVLYEFSKTSKIIRQDDETTVHSMIRVSDGIVNRSVRTFLAGEITTYKEFPYLFKLTTCANNDVENVAHINMNRAFELCSLWNSGVHITPTRLVLWFNGASEITNLSVVMTGLYAEEANDRTFMDLLCTLQKITTAWF